ncbi:Hypothetical protein SRAE_2000119800 [Strongyloides ratti]|uniref:Uncharacterized protein n=1 Tax=Strongyloides ratti TaxID=34506 RepID=A0A090LG83_STRRB|nr:Hypothetical protein SRAE_2000119800 [Strongyloides ratti]CEF66530.1 Hypothetical protein SRAE_2000119800 [Strongyloides ratti]
MSAINCSSLNSTFFVPTQKNPSRRIRENLPIGYINSGLQQNDDYDDSNIIEIKKEDKDSRNSLTVAFPSLIVNKIHDINQLEANCFSNTMKVAKNVVKSECRLEHYKCLLQKLENDVIVFEEKCMDHGLKINLVKLELKSYEETKKNFIDKHGNMLRMGKPNIIQLKYDLERIIKFRNNIIKLIENL